MSSHDTVRIRIASFLAAAAAVTSASGGAAGRAPQQSDGAASSSDVASRIDAARGALERWVEVRRTISEEVRDWALGREMLESRIDVLGRELAATETSGEEAGKAVAEADRKAADLVAQAASLKAASEELAATAGSLETRTKELLRRLPEPIREKVAPLAARLPEDPAKSSLSLSTRFQNVVAILNEVNKFHREITVTSEIRRLADGTSAEVTAVYLGIAQGYYVGGGGRLAGYGTATADGWTWTAANEIAPQVGRVVAILKNESPAEFVPVPLRIN